MRLLNVTKVARCAALLFVGCTVTGVISAQEVYVSRGGVALKGYDTVVYHTENKAVEGEEEYATEWNGAIWYFSSDDNRQLFVADPERYAPQYGGYCAYAMAQNQIASIDPKAFSVVDDKLYLNYSTGVRRRWEAEGAERLIQRADWYWPALRNTLQE